MHNHFFGTMRCIGFGITGFFLTSLHQKTEKVVKEVKRNFCELRILSKSSCNSGDFLRSILTFTILLFKNVTWRSLTMLSIPKTVLEMDEETETKKINYKLLAGNAVEDSATVENLSFI